MRGHLMEVESDPYTGNASAGHYEKTGHFPSHGETQPTNCSRLEVMRALHKDAGLT